MRSARLGIGLREERLGYLLQGDAVRFVREEFLKVSRTGQLDGVRVVAKNTVVM